MRFWYKTVDIEAIDELMFGVPRGMADMAIVYNSLKHMRFWFKTLDIEAIDKLMFGVPRGMADMAII